MDAMALDDKRRKSATWNPIIDFRIIMSSDNEHVDVQ